MITLLLLALLAKYATKHSAKFKKNGAGMLALGFGFGRKAALQPRETSKNQ
jgi:hypothetical protein